MRLWAAFIFLAAIPAAAQPKPAVEGAAAAEASESASGLRDSALDLLFSERGSAEAFAAAVADARKHGIGAQALLEARFLFHVDRQEDDAIAAMLPEFIARRDAFNVQESEIFSVKEDWLAVIEYVHAIAALKKGDKGSFKSHITEAFWLSPRQGSAFAPHIERVRLQDAMDALRIDFSQRFASLLKDEVVVLEDLMKEKKAMLFHFWSPWSHECEASMPQFVATAMALASKDVQVVSILPDDSPKSLTDARVLIRPLGPNPPGAWLVDSKDEPLGPLLRVQTMPTMVLVSAEGRVLFNGHPDDEALWKALKGTDASIARPEAADVTE